MIPGRCCCCAGFMQQFAAVVDDANPAMHMGRVLRELSGGRCPNRVLCTGHSLGGALATLGGGPLLACDSDKCVCCLQAGEGSVGCCHWGALHT